MVDKLHSTKVSKHLQLHESVSLTANTDHKHMVCVEIIKCTLCKANQIHTQAYTLVYIMQCESKAGATFKYQRKVWLP